MALINGIIPQQSFELAENAIGSILTTELANQFVLTANAKMNATVHKERVVPFDVKTAYPAINVKFDGGDYSNKDMTLTDGLYKYYIVAYVSANSTSSTDGDKEANINLQRLLGICRAILENPVYNNLNLSRPFVKNTYIGAIKVGVTDETLGAENSVCGYLEFYVKVPEYVLLKNAEELLSSFTQVKLYETDEGFQWEYESE